EQPLLTSGLEPELRVRKLVFSYYAFPELDSKAAGKIQSQIDAANSLVASHLADRFEEHDRDRSREIEAAGAVHRDREQPVGVRPKQRFRQALCLPAVDKEVAALKLHGMIGTTGFCCEEKITRDRILRRLQL